MKKRRLLYLDKDIYDKFKIHTIMINSNVSREVEKFMKERLDSIEQFSEKNKKK